jgi:hypothetical protein
MLHGHHARLEVRKIDRGWREALVLLGHPCIALEAPSSEAAGTIITASGLTRGGDVINLIPNQTSGAIARAAHLTAGD